MGGAAKWGLVVMGNGGLGIPPFCALTVDVLCFFEQFL